MRRGHMHSSIRHRYISLRRCAMTLHPQACMQLNRNRAVFRRLRNACRISPAPPAKVCLVLAPMRPQHSFLPAQYSPACLHGHVRQPRESDVGRPDAVVLRGRQGPQRPVEGSSRFGDELLVVDQCRQVLQPDSWHAVHRHEGSLECIIECDVCRVARRQSSDRQPPLFQVGMPELVGAWQCGNGTLVKDVPTARRRAYAGREVAKP